MSLEFKEVNGWSTENEKIYNNLSVQDRLRMNRAMILEIDTNVPFKRKTFKQLCFLTLKYPPDEIFKDRRVTHMQIELLQKQIDRLKFILKIKD